MPKAIVNTALGPWKLVNTLTQMYIWLKDSVGTNELIFLNKPLKFPTASLKVCLEHLNFCLLKLIILSFQSTTHFV